ncbi:MAG: cysteine--tRNA ligase [Candidatus Nezhaarchaeota archaeon]|nr:cysteine--tRNA ligase [Candidatus Nezhaarchaeota archaeon]
MAITIYNTFTRSLEAFEPFNPPKVGMYVCGPTVYDYTHVGHARTYVAFDVVKRFLAYKGFNVVYVQNITDVDDKIINRALKEGVEWRTIAEKYTRDYMEMLDKLHIEVDFHPKATLHVKEMVDFISKLVEAGFAYESNGSVYFDVDKFLNYGGLSKKVKGEEWSQEEAFLQEKRRPYDFALWKRAKPGEPYWESPWGFGRPGWHIECSVMSSYYLGATIDIHGGGADLIFPHHENEIAQSEARYGIRPWVKYWLHAGYLMIRGEKMSKSLGNIVSLKEVFDNYRPGALRLMLSLTHYRSTIDFSFDLLERYEKVYERVRRCVELLTRLASNSSPSFKVKDEELEVSRRLDDSLSGFLSSLETDFNGAKAAKHFHDIVSLSYNRIIESDNAELAVKALRVLRNVNNILAFLDDVLGARSLQGELVDKLVRIIVDLREVHRSRREYEIADKIREQLESIGVKLMDSRRGTTWIYC